MAIYLLIHVRETSKNTFRHLLFAVLVSIMYDLVWFSVKLNVSRAPDSGTEQGLRSFSMSMAFIGFVVRMFVFTIYWKASLDFDAIMSNKRNDAYLRTIVV